MPLAYRYALYLAPPEPWRSVGDQWLGRSPETGEPIAPAAGADPRQAGWTSDPRHYGLHATLKPPFRLRPGTTAGGLDTAMRALAARTQPFDAPLQCRELRGFLAWCLADDAGAQARMRTLGADAVRSLDDWRAPPTEAEVARRRKAPLSPAHEAMLERWGYPYVFDQFVFHITLSAKLAGQDLEDAKRQVQAMSEPLLREPMPVRAVSLYVQPEPDAPFLVARHYGFDGGTIDCAGAGFLQDGAA
jgi:2'-5' RNA ligase